MSYEGRAIRAVSDYESVAGEVFNSQLRELLIRKIESQMREAISYDRTLRAETKREFHKIMGEM